MLKTNDSIKKQYLTVFGLSFVLAFIIFIPFMAMDNGLFVYYGDFNVQQIPFYQICHTAIREGNIFWNFKTDLGTNFIGSYAFYTLGSPFFWLTIPFPTSFLPYLMAPLLMLKMSVAAVTSFGFLKRFVKNPNFALIGALLYAFSGFSIYNIFFNHFHDVMAFFPLLLSGVEENIINKRRGVFALAVALNAIVNYYFFFGEVIFVVVYFFVRLSCKGDFTLNFKQFFAFLAEAVFGVMIAAVIMVPAFIAVLGNPRTEKFLLGWNGIMYSSVQRYGLITHSFFYPPDIPAYPNFFPDANAKWSSVGIYLPMFTMTGVFALMKSKGTHFLKRLFLILLVIVYIPFFNASFSAFNNSFYTRWYFMLSLILALMTVVALERYPENIKFGIKWTAISSLAFALIGIFPSTVNGKIVFAKLPKYPDRFWMYVLIVFMGLVLTYLLTKVPKKYYFKATTLSLCFIILFSSIYMISLGHGNETTRHRVIEMGLNGEEKFTVFDNDSDEFYRIDMYKNDETDKKCMDNFPMFWQMPTIQAFHSVVPGSIFEFFTEVFDTNRSVGSRPSISYKGYRSLTSTKYLLTYHNEKDPDTEGFDLVKTENEFDIYKNRAYIPMGFTYDYYVDKKAFTSFDKKNRDRLLVSAIYLDEEQIERHKDILKELPSNKYPVLTAEGLEADAKNRSRNSCSTFVTDNRGFTAEINTLTEELVFFSVPFEKGWSATVNGEEAQIEKVNAGFMAVRVPKGKSTIRFDYKTPGLHIGALLTLLGAFLLAAYMVMMQKVAEKNPFWRVSPYRHKNSEPENSQIVAAEMYAKNLTKKG